MLDAESEDPRGARDSQAGRFVCVKPTEALRTIALSEDGEQYVTQADLRIASGTVSFESYPTTQVILTVCIVSVFVNIEPIPV